MSKHAGNESRTCKIMGHSRDSSYPFMKPYEQGYELA